MKDRRKFLRRIVSVAGAAMLPYYQSAGAKALERELVRKSHLSAGQLSADEDFWNLVHQAYTVTPNLINLNNGGVSPQPRIVQEAVEHYNRLSNNAPSHYMWKTLAREKEPLRKKLAGLAGCDPEEIAVNRNSSEALETVIFGLRLQKGDEVILSRQDYPNMINAWKQREHRDGIVLKWLDFQFPLEDKTQIVDTFTAAMTPRTKLVHVTHVINWMGQIMPVRQIADEAKKRGIEVLVDAAHSFAHLEYTIPGLNCDYLGTSLHKWLCAPFGSGMLYVKKEKISRLYPLLAAPEPESDDIRKFENLGTRSLAIEQAIGHAINFHEMIGIERKQQRLQYLKTYWTKKVLELPGISIGTSLLPEYSCAIALLQVSGKEPAEVNKYLFENHEIHAVSIKWENISGVRITPNVYTRTKDLDVLVEAVQQLTKA